MDARKSLSILALAVGLTAFLSVSGCVEPRKVATLGWEHSDATGTAVRIWGQLALTESIQNWEEGFVWDTQMHADWRDYENFAWADHYEAVNRFSLDIEGLDRLTTYHYRAYVEDSQTGTVVSVGDDREFIPGAPSVQTDLASDLSAQGADLHGELLHMGGAAGVDVWFEYGTNPASLDIEAGHQTLTQPEHFHATLTGLDSCTKYYFRAVAVNDADTHQGLTRSFTPGEPGIGTRHAIDVTADTATLRGELSDLAGRPNASVWFEYGDAHPQNLDKTTTPQTMDVPGDFSADITDLNPFTRYYFRAVADNGLCDEVAGAVVDFTTLPPDP